nr:hypothetical protein [Lachnospiraceae bacterium]
MGQLKISFKVKSEAGFLRAVAVCLLLTLITVNLTYGLSHKAEYTITHAAESEKETIPQGRYTRDKDGIWRRTDENIELLFKKISRNIKYSAYTVSYNNAQMEFSHI